jgi:uncharacterized delta-60 repeat protein
MKRRSRSVGWFAGFPVVALVAVVTVAAAAASVLAGAGSLDTSWGGAGYVTTSFGGDWSTAFGVGVQHDGKVIAVGGVGTASTENFAIARYNSDGTLDHSFGTGGRVVTDFAGLNSQAHDVAFEGDKIVVAGDAATDPDLAASDFAVARYLKNGTLDTSFGTGGKVVTDFGGTEDHADAVAVKGNTIVVVGASGSGGGTNFALSRYNDDGSLDTSFGSGGLVTTDFHGAFDGANDVAFDGKDVLVAGYVGYGTANPNFELAAYSADGTLDASFGTGGKVETDFGHGADYGHSIDVQGDRILVVGSASNGANQDFAAAVYDTRGTLEPRFNGTGMSMIDMGGDDESFAGAFGADHSVVAVGCTPNGFGDRIAVARWASNGASDPSFGIGGYATTAIGATSCTSAMGLAPGNKIIAAGFSDNAFLVVRYLNR